MASQFEVTICSDKGVLNIIDLYDAAIYMHYFSEPRENNNEDVIVSVVQSFKYDLGNRFSDLDYNKCENAIGYVCRFASLHAGFVRHLLSKAICDCEILRNVLNSNSINVLSIGGGAGHDMIGFCSALNENIDCFSKFMNLTVTDSCSGWSTCFNNAIEILRGEKYFGNLSELFQIAQVNTQFITADIIDPNSDFVETKKCIQLINEADIILMVKLLSILTLDQIDDITEEVVKCTKVGSLLVTIDSPEYEERFQEYRVKSFIEPQQQLNIVYRSEKEKYTLSSTSKYHHLNVPVSTGSIIIYRLEKSRRKRACPVDVKQRVKESKKSNMDEFVSD